MLIPVLVAVWFWPLLLLPPTILLLRTEKRIRSWFRVKEPARLCCEMLNPRRVLTVAWLNVAIDIATFCGMWQSVMSRHYPQGDRLFLRIDAQGYEAAAAQFLSARIRASRVHLETQ